MNVPSTLRSVTLLTLSALLGGCVVHVGGGGAEWRGFQSLHRSESSLRGDGHPTAQERDVGTFERVEISGAFRVRLGVGGAAGVRLAGDSNLLEHVSTRVEDGTLEVRPERSLAPVTPLELEISCPALLALTLSGASKVELAGLDGGAFELALSGSHEVVATGRVDRLELASSGSQRIHLDGLVAREASVALSGSSRVRLNVEERVALESSGASSVELRGGAVLSSSHQSGSLRLERKDD